jgi:CHAT domain-containing protein/tetratricopeptide (TPR) repeat protein
MMGHRGNVLTSALTPIWEGTLRSLLLAVTALIPPPAERGAAIEIEVRDQEVVEVRAEQAAADVALEIVGPGDQAWTLDWTRPPRPEVLPLATAGRYRVTSRAADGQAPRALPPLEVLRRPAQDGDRERESLTRALGDAATKMRTGQAADTAAARTLLEASLERLDSLGGGGPAALVRVRLGEVLLASGDPARAESLHREALERFEALGDCAGTVDAQNQLGLVQSWKGNAAGANEWYARALPDARVVGDRLTEAFLHANLGTASVYLGENQKALDHFRAAIAVAREAGARRPEGWALTNLARLWHALGDLDRALEQAQQALPVMDQSGDVKGKVAARLNLGVILIALGRHDEAIDALTRGLALATASGQKQAEATVRGRLGEALAGRGDVAAAIQAYREALILYEAQRARRAQGLVLAGLGAAQLRAGDAAGRESLERALDLGRASGDPSIEVAALKGLASDALARGDLGRARDLSAQALSTVESVRLQVAAPEMRSSYFASMQDYYEQRIAVLLASHQAQPDGGFAAEAFHTSERARARSLLEGLAGGRADIRAGVAPELLEREAALRRAMERASARFMRALAAGRETEAATLEKEIAAQLSQFQELQAEMQARSPRYAALTQPVPLTLSQVQEELLDDDTTLVEIALGAERSHAFIIGRRSFRVAELPPRRVLDELARALYSRVSERPARGASWVRDGGEAASALGRALLAPLAPLATRRLAVVTQGALQYVPFAVLRDPDRPAPLLADHEVVTLPSASALAVLRRETAGRSGAALRVAILADPVLDPGDARLPAREGRGRATPPAEEQVRSARFARLTELTRLPFTRREARAIVQAAGVTGVRTALGFEANRDLALSPELSRYRVLHFATHGLLNDERPDLSGLVLSLFDREGRPRDGFLRLADIYNLDLPAELVVLSACRTGLGKNVRGEGLVGLSRAFMYAGAPRVLASSWTVDDAATAELMAAFYRMLFVQRRPAAEALRGAQLHMQKHPRWRHPYYWAAFTLQGEWK